MFTRIEKRYQGTTAVVVGAGGIGGELLRLLATRCSRLLAADHDPGRLESLETLVSPAAMASTATPALPAKLFTRELDVRSSEAVGEFFQFCRAEVGPPDFLFYTAGVLNIEPFTQTSPELWSRAVDVNLNGAFHCVREGAALMREQGRGSILLLGSIAGTKARSGSRVNPVYNTTKAALAAFVNATAMQLRPQGVRINCISPGPTATTMMDVQPAGVHAAVNEIMLDHRMNDPAEVAELALFVAAHGRFTGEDVPLGGGAGLGG